MILESEDFRLHYPAEDSLSVRATDSLFAVSLFQLQEELNYYTNKTIDVFFFKTRQTLLLDRMLPKLEDSEGVIGLKPLVVQLSLDSDWERLKYDMRSQIAQLLVEEMLYGGSLQDKIKSANLVNLPDWVLPGLYHYLGAQWSIHDDNMWRSVYENHGFQNFNQTPQSCLQVKGASFWKFIKHKHGKSAIPSLLYMMRLTRKMNSALFYAFQKSMKEVSLNWATFYNSMYELDQKRLSPIDGIKLTTEKLIDLSVVSDTLFYSIEKSFLGYSLYEHSGGDFVKSKIYHHKVATDEELDIKGFVASQDEIKWLVGKGETYFRYTLELTSGDITKQEVKVPYRISKAKLTGEDSAYFASSSWHSSYVYRHTSSSNELFRVKGFISSFDVLDNSIVASVQYGNSFEIWHKKIGAASRRVYSSEHLLTDVVWGNDTIVLFNAGVDGILNGKILNLKTGKLSSVTNYRYNITSHQYDQNVFAEYIDKGEYSELFIAGYLPIDKLYTYDTIYTTASMYANSLSHFNTDSEPLDEEPDSLLDYTFQSPVRPLLDFSTQNLDSLAISQIRLDANESSVWEGSRQLFFSKAYFRLTNTGDFIEQTPYEEAIILQTPNRVNLELGFSFSNKLDNRRLTIGATGLVQSGALDLYATYSEQFDWLREFQILNRRRVSFDFDERKKYITTVGKVSFSKPLFIKGLSLSHSYNIRHDEKTSLILNPESLEQVDSKNQDIILGQTSSLYFGRDWPFRKLSMEVGFSPNYSLLSKGYNFTTDFKIDYFQTLNTRLVLKGRSRIMNSWGGSPHFFMLGGFQSDLNTSNFQREYANYKGPMLYSSLFGVRGFPLNYRNGNTAMYANVQLDWQFLGSLMQRPIVSEFFSNLTLRSFIDLGTSFYGRSVFDDANVLNQKTIRTETNSIVIQVNAFKNPFIGSLGVGLGSRIFGYSVSLDAALGYESQVVNPVIFHLNIGHDF